jgi:TolB-like protein
MASIPLEDKAPPLPDVPSIAVMPFSNISGDPKQEYFSDGITQDLTVALAKLPDVLVIGPPSAFSYKGKPWKPMDVGRELGVQYLVEGSVRRADNMVRVTAHLVDAPTGRELWVENYDRRVSDRFALQDEVVHRTAKTLNIRVQLEQAGISDTEVGAMLPHGIGAASSEAYNDFLQGSLRLFTYTKDGIAQGRQLEQKAIALDPNYGFAYVMLGNSYVLDVVQQWDQEGDLDRADQAAQKAIAVADTNLCASCGYMLASIVALVRSQNDKALTYAERAVELDHNLPPAYLALAMALLQDGRAEEALAAVQKAMRRDPRNPDFYLGAVADAYMLESRYSEAIPVLERRIARYPYEIGGHVPLAVAYAEVGRGQDAHAEAIKVFRINPEWSVARSPQVADAALRQRWNTDLKEAGFKLSMPATASASTHSTFQ